MNLYEKRNKLAEELADIEDQIKKDELAKRCSAIKLACENIIILKELAKLTDASSDTIRHLGEMETWDDDYEIELTVRKVRQ